MSRIQARTGKMHALDADCLTVARERFLYLYENYDHVTVGFSGGKDSTTCLNLAIEAARKTGRLPVDAFSFDEEAIPPETVEYLERIANNPDVNLKWYCVPIKHRNACSDEQPYWYPWAPEDEHKWVRPLPATAITDFPGFRRTDIQDLLTAMYPPSMGTVANVLGIRTQESMTRYRSIASKRGDFAWIASREGHIVKMNPIYDWKTEDVWRAPHVLGWDYNRAYDLMEKAGVPRSMQRCSPAFGEQPIRRLYTYKICWPELWAKMCDRLPGVATAARYANTELYGVGVKTEDLTGHDSWRDYIEARLDELPDESRQEVAEAIDRLIKTHRRYADNDPIPDSAPHPISGFSWKLLSIPATIGGDKFARQSQKVAMRAMQFRKAIIDANPNSPEAQFIIERNNR